MRFIDIENKHVLVIDDFFNAYNIENIHRTAILDLRLPRVLLALLVGFSL